VVDVVVVVLIASGIALLVLTLAVALCRAAAHTLDQEISSEQEARTEP
jgi:hypothetical protein